MSRLTGFLATGLLACAMAATAPARAATPDTVDFAALTWTEIRDALRGGETSIIIPVGGTEQSGPYIAVGKHDVRAMILARRIARQAGHALVAPVIAYVPEGGTSPRTSHMRFPGTISITPATFRALLADAAESFRVQGFSRVVLIGDHGGYQKDLRAVADLLNRRWRGLGAHVLYIPAYYDVVPGAYATWLRNHGHAAEVGMHADLSDTSLMLALDPALVRAQALATAPLPTPAQGVYGGDPRRADAALGQVGANMQVSAAVAAMQHDPTGQEMP
ncbi:creatininase family protein [Komagataeibacter rhaeticus]|nr:creatininase family protein [Komagataeibacter rhaeticus]QOC47704.1 creatininase family protein [Komagataeibacter rhaeticus]WPP22935.1 creatininase family protein [Komagataeibacter rhaeticus]SAY48314.1 Creatinine amidohydrolase [Komagataeibacter rhaeticus]